MNEKRLWKLFLLPSLGGVLVFYLLPFVLSLYYGMIDNMGSRQFVGLQNVVETLNSPMFLQAAGNTAGYLGLSIPLILLLSLGLAFLLHRGNRTLLFALLVPLVLPSGVTAFFWNAIFSASMRRCAKLPRNCASFWAKWWKSLRNRREKSEFSPDFRKNSGKTCKKD